MPPTCVGLTHTVDTPKSALHAHLPPVVCRKNESTGAGTSASAPSNGRDCLQGNSKPTSHALTPAEATASHQTTGTAGRRRHARDQPPRQPRPSQHTQTPKHRVRAPGSMAMAHLLPRKNTHAHVHKHNIANFLAVANTNAGAHGTTQASQRTRMRQSQPLVALAQWLPGLQASWQAPCVHLRRP